MGNYSAMINSWRLRPVVFSAIAWALVSGAIAPAAAVAQTGSALLPSSTTRRHGLETMWFTQIDLDAAQGRLAGLRQHVSTSKSETIFEIVDDGQVYLFSERDRNAFGEMVGVDGAQKKADEQLAKIVARLESEKSTAAPPVVTKHILPEITFYATGERGVVHAIDGHTGKTRWSTTVGLSHYPTTAPSANNDVVAVINGSTLYILRSDSGEIVWQKRVGGAPGCAPALSAEMVFVPMINGAVEQYNINEPNRPVQVHRSFGHTFVQPVVSNEVVAWPTDKGNLYVGNANAAGMRFRMEAKDAISSAPAFLKPGKIFAASLDGYLYCVDEKRGGVLWRFTTGEPISHSPVAFGDTVYVVTDNGHMYAVSANDPVEKWVATGIESYLAGNEKRLYAVDQSGNLVILDTNSGSRIGTISSLGLDLRFLNIATDRIIVGTTSGVLQCLRETDRRWPNLYVDADPPKKKASDAPGQQTKPMDPGAEPAPAVDPFGDGGADPFGAPAPKPMPMPAEPDPFGDGGADPFGAPAPKPMPMPMPAEADPFG